MHMMKGALILFVSLAIGYALCVLADKQKNGLLRTVGYTLGAAIIALSLLYSALDSRTMMCHKSKKMYGCKGMKDRPGVFLKGQVK